MRKVKNNRAMAVLLALVMALTVITPAFALRAYDYYVPKETYQPSSIAELADNPELLERYNREQRTESTRQSLYSGAPEELFALPAGVKPIPLPEELGLDPLTYWDEICQARSCGDAGENKTARPTEELYQEIRQLVDDLTEGLTTVDEKYTAMVMWVENNMTGKNNVNKERTDNVFYAYERRYGFCMEHSNMLYLMATLAGIPAVITRSPPTRLPNGHLYPGHQATEVLEEHGIWIGDAHHTPTEAFYIDGTTKYKMDFTTGELTNMGEIKVPDKQPEPDPVPDANFSDVPASAWYAGAVNWAVAKGITNGTGATTFSPAKTCTQGEIIVFLYRAAGSPKADADLPFTVKNAWATDALKWAYSKDIIYSIDENAPCTRATAVYYIWKAFGSHAAQSENKFTDLGGYENYKRAISWAVENGIVAGTSPTTFSPDLTCDRGTIVTLLHRAYSK